MGEPQQAETPTTEDGLDEPSEDAGIEELLREMEGAGLPRSAIEDAVRRAKIKTAIRRNRGSSPPPSRPKLDTNPDLDSWFD